MVKRIGRCVQRDLSILNMESGPVTGPQVSESAGYGFCVAGNKEVSRGSTLATEVNISSDGCARFFDEKAG